ncbi:IS200/IS605 family transposase [Marinomonas algarum]|uniref:IS200/IS605 family transposase n=1 Tax=Marinomonas algarum TaxID=2883105 RepID=A0A9X1IMB1_9GAMM|nr:IS200/IS605 family transposase [Marinomonas algarum]MCB5161434.1 IS200/IS605 family transposase [Marinomonas algarum]MCB5161495.1 IS200/IS605 family transposase [Marinomonas algarum]
MYEWRTGRSCVYKNQVHLVFVTKYRRSVFTLEMGERLREVFSETCDQMQCELMEYSFEDNHVHLMVQAHPKVAISNVVGKLKGKSSYVLRKEYWESVRTKLWGDRFWSPSYCVVSCGGGSLEQVAAYIESQNKPPSSKSVKQSKAISKQ